MGGYDLNNSLESYRPIWRDEKKVVELAWGKDLLRNVKTPTITAMWQSQGGMHSIKFLSIFHVMILTMWHGYDDVNIFEPYQHGMISLNKEFKTLPQIKQYSETN